MKKSLLSLTALFSLCLVPSFLGAAEEVTKEGTMSCAKCNLGIAEKCSDVLEVTEGDAVATYWLEEGGKQKTTKHVCSGSAPAKVTGVVEERDGEKFIVTSSIEV